MHLHIIINGAITVTPTRKKDRLSTVLNRALKLSGNTRRPAREWQMRDVNGVLLETQRDLADFKFESKTRLFLSLAVGAGGAA